MTVLPGRRSPSAPSSKAKPMSAPIDVFAYCPPGVVGRRATDLSIEIGAATEPNMSQDEIDSLIKPMLVMAE